MFWNAKSGNEKVGLRDSDSLAKRSAAAGHTAGVAGGGPTAGGLKADRVAARLAAAGPTALVLAPRQAAARGVVADSVAVHRGTGSWLQEGWPQLDPLKVCPQLLDPQQVG